MNTVKYSEIRWTNINRSKLQNSNFPFLVMFIRTCCTCWHTCGILTIFEPIVQFLNLSTGILRSYPTLIATPRGVRWSWFVMFLKQSFGSRSTSHWRHWSVLALAALCSAVLALESVILITISLVPPSVL